MDKQKALKQLNDKSRETLMETLQIVYTDLDLDAGTLSATMPVSPGVHQPMGLLHGGASAALAESVGSAASAMFVDNSQFAILGIELSCNHLSSKRKGMLTATARILHKGRSTHLWEIRIEDENAKLISHCKLTNMIVPLKK